MPPTRVCRSERGGPCTRESPTRFEREFDPEETGGLLSLHFFLAGDLERGVAVRATGGGSCGRAVRASGGGAALSASDRGRHPPWRASRSAGDRRSLSSAHRGPDPVRRAACRRRGEREGDAIWKDDPVESGRALLKRGKIQSRLQTFSRAFWWIARSRSVLAASDQPEAGTRRGRRGGVLRGDLNRLGRTTESARWAHRAVEEAEASGNQRALAESFDLLDTINMEAGEPIGEYWDRAFEIYRSDRRPAARRSAWLRTRASVSRRKAASTKRWPRTSDRESSRSRSATCTPLRSR